MVKDFRLRSHAYGSVALTGPSSLYETTSTSTSPMSHRSGGAGRRLCTIAREGNFYETRPCPYSVFAILKGGASRFANCLLFRKHQIEAKIGEDGRVGDGVKGVGGIDGNEPVSNFAVQPCPQTRLPDTPPVMATLNCPTSRNVSSRARE